MTRLELKCRIPATITLGAPENTKPEQKLMECVIYLDPNNILEDKTIIAIKNHFDAMALLCNLPKKELWQFEADLYEK